ncbi:MAG: FeoA family protein [Halobacteriota archaeon]
MRSRSRISGGLIEEHLHELKEAIPLAFLSEGEEGEIVELSGGRGMIQRLSDMGFTPSTKIRVLKTKPPGPMLVDVRDARIALGRGVAMNILVNGVKKGKGW